MVDDAVVDLRKSTAALISRAISGDLHRDELVWPGPDADESVRLAIGALDEYLDHCQSNDSLDESYWVGELTRMERAIAAGKPLEHEQLSGWRGVDITWVVIAGVLGIGLLAWWLFG